VIQYSEAPVMESTGRSVLDTPLARGMTAVLEERKRALPNTTKSDFFVASAFAR
jgi:hypothetical protein